MQLIVYIPFAICIIGLLIYFANRDNAKVQAIAGKMFFAGLLVTLLQIVLIR